VNTAVPDASVAAKWFLHSGENLIEEALALFQQYSAGRLKLVVPDLFWAEFGNLLWKAARQGRCSREAQYEATHSMLACNIPTVSSARLLPEAVRIATAFDRTVYDSLYVALAVTVRAPFITADERLANALAAHLPVKWLGAF
jgi:predicted nucleic acid-binding protein